MSIGYTQGRASPPEYRLWRLESPEDFVQYVMERPDISGISFTDGNEIRVDPAWIRNRELITQVFRDNITYFSRQHLVRQPRGEHYDMRVSVFVEGREVAFGLWTIAAIPYRDQRS